MGRRISCRLLKPGRSMKKERDDSSSAQGSMTMSRFPRRRGTISIASGARWICSLPQGQLKPGTKVRARSLACSTSPVEAKLILEKENLDKRFPLAYTKERGHITCYTKVG